MGLNTEKLKERFEKKQGRGDRFELKDNENNIRILPPSLEYLTESVDYIAFEYLIHYNLGVEGDKKAEVCPKTYGKPHKCPICEAVAKLYKLNTAEDKALAGQLRAKRRFLFNVIDMNEKDKGIQILEMGPKNYEALVVFITNPKWGDLLDLDKGRDITINKTNAKESSTGWAEYSVAPDPNITSIREVLPKNFKEGIGLLKKAIPVAKSYEELKAVLEGEEVVAEPVKEKPAPEKGYVEKEEVTEVEEAPVKAKVEKKEPDGKQPTCFGEQYGPRRPECLACTFKTECRSKFLDM